MHMAYRCGSAVVWLCARRGNPPYGSKLEHGEEACAEKAEHLWRPVLLFGNAGLRGVDVPLRRHAQPLNTFAAAGVAFLLPPSNAQVQQEEELCTRVPRAGAAKIVFGTCHSCCS